jgi:hypothetical protein
MLKSSSGRVFDYNRTIEASSPYGLAIKIMKPEIITKTPLFGKN